MKEKLEELKLKLQSFGTPADRYEYIIGRSKELEAFPQEKKTEDFLIKGCVSQLWLAPEIKNQSIHFYGFSEALIVNGIVAIILNLVNSSSVEEVLNLNDLDLAQVGLTEALSMNRRSGLTSLLSKIHLYAKVFSLTKQ